MRIVLDYDGSSGKIAVLLLRNSLSEQNPAIADSESHKIIDVKLEDILANGSEEASQYFGNLVLNLLEIGVDGGINHEGLELQTKETYKAIEKRAEGGDSNAQFLFGSMCVDESVSKKDEKLLEKAELWFKRAANLGNKESMRFLESNWPNLKDVYTKKIRNQK